MHVTDSPVESTRQHRLQTAATQMPAYTSISKVLTIRGHFPWSSPNNLPNKETEKPVEIDGSSTLAPDLV